MEVYQYSPDTGEYLGARVAQPSPLEPGQFLVPANATTAPPISVSPGHVARWTGTGWEEVIDLRGTVYWLPDGSEHWVSEIGVTLPVDASTDEPTLPATSQDVNEERNRRILLGKDFVVTGYATPIAVAGDATTQTNLSNLAQAAMIRTGQGDVTHITNYRDENNLIHALTPPQIIELWSLGAAYVSAIYAASWVLKDNPAGVPVDFVEDVHWP